MSLTGDTRGAFDQFEETVRRSPNFSQAHYSLGVLLAASGRYPEAVTPFSIAVRYEPNYVEARLQLAATLARTGQLEKSLAQYKQVLTVDPRVADARFGYAMALVGLQRYREAHDSLSEAARLYPDQQRFAEVLNRLEDALEGKRQSQPDAR